MLFELRGLAQNALMAVGPVRRYLHRFGSTGMNGNSAAAREQIESYIRDVGDLNGKDVLELGPGHTPQVLLLAIERGARRAVGLDVERQVDDTPFTSRGVELRVYGGKTMPFPDASFDVVWSSDVLEHLRHPEVTLREAARVLRPGGLMLAAIDLRDHYFLLHEARWLHCLRYPEPAWRAMTSNRSSFVNRWRASDWRAAFDRAGFAPLRFDARTSDVLRDLHDRGEIRRFGPPLSRDDAATYRLDVTLVKRPA